MSYYRLTAEGRGNSETVEFYSENDSAAMMEAMFSHILATDASPVWGFGEIILRNVNTGEIVNTMDAKD